MGSLLDAILNSRAQALKHHRTGNLQKIFQCMFRSELCEMSTLSKDFSTAQKLFD